MESKTCTKCGETKPATNEYFYNNKADKSGLSTWCKDCARAWREANRGIPRAWNAAKRKERAEYKRALNAEDKAECARAWREGKPEVAHAIVERAWTRARKLTAEGNYTAEDLKAIYAAQKGRCYYCNENVGDNYHADHVVPLSRGGSNGPDNLVVACPTCNLRKRDKLPHEWKYRLYRTSV